MSEVITFRARRSTGAAAPRWDVCPSGRALGDYDRRNVALFAWLLHDEAEGASEDDLARDVFGFAHRRYSAWARKVVRSHLERAHWLRDNAFPFLGW